MHCIVHLYRFLRQRVLLQFGGCLVFAENPIRRLSSKYLIFSSQWIHCDKRWLSFALMALHQFHHILSVMCAIRVCFKAQMNSFFCLARCGVSFGCVRACVCVCGGSFPFDLITFHLVRSLFCKLNYSMQLSTHTHTSALKDPTDFSFSALYLSHNANS